MTKPSNPQSQKRALESLGSLFDKVDGQKSFLFIKSSSDEGVIRNGGRNGSRFAPRSLLSYFKKLNINSEAKSINFSEIEVSSIEEEKSDFHEAQIKESIRIEAALKNLSSDSIVFHIGGGHDHIYPLLRAYSGDYSKIIVLNIDAHADTRTDELHHSGTPFRQFAEEFQGEFYLYQIGLHQYANSESTLSPLPKGTSAVLWKEELDDLDKVDQYFEAISSAAKEKALVIFSLDADAMTSSEVPGVSAVNGDGITRGQLLELWNRYEALPKVNTSILGLYELNPVYDTLSMGSMRVLGTFLYQVSLNKKARP